ncbi:MULTISPECIES: LPXTG cell wall anchor domain-containing protein [unclassified Micromonospora]|uniref:LPXTG cell wall anchor domain-containing protein n=1 Tax=unclassified Micromonospora TaxID=2617518 RepID=UPI0033B0E6DC
MTPFHRSALARAGVVALLAAGGLATVAAPAQAADQADLALVPLSYELAKGVKEAKAKPFKFQVDNTRSTVDAKDVRVTVETKGLKDRKVGVLAWDGCEVAGTTFSCLLGDLAAGTTEDFGIPLFSTGGRGAAGTLVVTVSSATADPFTDDNTVEHEITVAKPGYDLTTWVQDVYADVVVDGDETGEAGRTSVRPGETAPLDWAVYNDGSRKATGLAYGFTLPAGVTFAELPEGCVEQPLNGLANAYCEDSGVVLKPGQFYTADVRVRVRIGADVTEPVLRPGFLFAAGLDAAQGSPEEQPQVATSAQRRAFTETDHGDNIAQFDVFVDLTVQPTPTPTPTLTATSTPTVTATPTPGGTTTPGATTSPGAGGGGGGGDDDGGLPVTGVQVGLIGGIGGMILLAGGALLVLSRRRKVVLVAPGDEKSTD